MNWEDFVNVCCDSREPLEREGPQRSHEPAARSSASLARLAHEYENRGPRTVVAS